MAGNVLGKGYTAGVGMTIGTAYGRIAGKQAAQFVLSPIQPHLIDSGLAGAMALSPSLEDTLSEES
jgi:hypothetical protein